jgi:signal transduction histidine kinase
MVLPVDAPKVERILENLLANAVKYSPEGTPVCVRVERVPEGAILSVEDSGPGVPEDIRESMFEPFRQGDNASAHSPGVGIGLSLVARFAELHGGRAWWEAREGGGSCFRVLLRDPTAPRTEEPG